LHEVSDRTLTAEVYGGCFIAASSGNGRSLEWDEEAGEQG